MNTKREPSIHITESNLKKLYKQYHDYKDEVESYVDDMVEYIMKEGKKLALEKRTLNITNQTLAKKALSKVTNDKTDISQLAKVIHTVRQKLKHRGIKPIDVNSSEWSALKKLTPVINQFCNDFELDKQKGYVTYVKMGLLKITSFKGYITKLYDMSETISNTYESQIIIDDDENKSLTKKIHEYYVQKVVKQTGIFEGFENNPFKYRKFVEAAKIVKKYKVDYEIFIDAQFEGLDWTGNYPEPEQLITEKSIERLNKFVYSSKGKEAKNNKLEKTNSDLVDALKKIKKK